jgi:sugar/nucleoside kinase (ribokinase family)
MLPDSGANTTLTPADLPQEPFRPGAHLHLSGYSLMRAPIDGAARRGAELARRAGARVSVDLSAWTRIRDFGASAFREQVERLEPDVVFANEAEWQMVGGAYALAPTAVVKRGAQGMRVIGNDACELPPPAGEIVDATGAGDAVAAGFLVGGPQLAVETAARCLAKLGAMP